MRQVTPVQSPRVPFSRRGGRASLTGFRAGGLFSFRHPGGQSVGDVGPAPQGFFCASQCRIARSAFRGAQAGRMHKKGFGFAVGHSFIFRPVQLVIQQVIPLHLFIEAPMEQQELRLFGRLDAPSVVPPHLINQCKTYRDAVKLCWALRRVKYMTQAQLAERVGLYAPHVSGYLRDGKGQRDLPGDYVKGFQCECGNTAISQWHAMGASLTVVEEMQLLRAAA